MEKKCNCCGKPAAPAFFLCPECFEKIHLSPACAEYVVGGGNNKKAKGA